MLNRPTQSSQKESSFLTLFKHNPNHILHHGTPDSRLLLEVPSETLLGITSYLDPPSLFALARVHDRLNEHVKDDNTWYRAFICQFLGIGPESDIYDNIRNIMLRRSESTWKKEFIVRYKLRRRWERSRNTTVAHIPVNSEISSIYLMAGHALLTSSIQYGIVSRSLPFSGKILPGYINASGVHLGLGVGNPNAEFTPNVSACALSSDGGTAKVLWGFRHGELAVATVPRAMDGSRRPLAEFVRCDARDEHQGAILDVGWDEVVGNVAVSAGADGRIKIWDAKIVRCLWTSEANVKYLAPEAYVTVKVSASQGIVVAVKKNGDLAFWSGFNMQTAGVFSAPSVNEVHVACLVEPPETNDHNNESREILAFHIDPHAVTPTVLVSYRNSPLFYQVQVDQTGTAVVRTFGEPSFSPLCAVTPCFSQESSFILTGDHIGCVSVYDWRSEQRKVAHSYKFEAHDNMASVTAIAWDGVALITGSAKGTTDVWDALSFEHLRSFPSPISRVRGGRGVLVGNPPAEGPQREAVRQIVVGSERDVMIASVGDRVLTWKAGPAPHHSGGGVRGRHTSGSIPRKKKDHGMAKYHQQVELHQAITESRMLLEQESDYVRQKNGREREHREQLESMGLSEVEAVEYVLMLSREEAVQGGVFDQEEGVFEGDFDRVPTPVAGSLDNFETGTAPARESSSKSNSAFSTPNTQGRLIPRATPSRSNEKVQLSPPFHPEPMEAGLASESVSRPQSSGSDVASDDLHFPSISASSSVAGSPTTESIAIGGESPQGSVRSGGTPSAWSTPLTRAKRLPASSSSSPTDARLIAGSSNSGSGGRTLPRGVSVREEEMDEDLKFALELSLAEARSRGEEV